MNDDPATRLRENATGVAATVVTGIWLALLFAPVGGNLWLVALFLGYLVVVPLVALLYGDEADRAEWLDDWWTEDETTSRDESGAADPADERDPLETLRERYAAGELTDEQFERKLERLLETETLEDAAEWRGDAREERDRVRESRVADGDREPEFET